jgi:CheY-like chemotaxis protein
LVVDDDPQMAKLSARIIARLGIRTQTKEGGIPGLEAIRALQGRLALLLTDVNMPGMEGTQMASTAGKEGLLIDVPVVFMTGKMWENLSKTQAVAAEGTPNEVIEKPFDIDGLVKAIQRACEKVLQESA